MFNLLIMKLKKTAKELLKNRKAEQFVDILWFVLHVSETAFLLVK
jgi:hypothetical protein